MIKKDLKTKNYIHFQLKQTKIKKIVNENKFTNYHTQPVKTSSGFLRIQQLLDLRSGAVNSLLYHVESKLILNEVSSKIFPLSETHITMLLDG